MFAPPPVLADSDCCASRHGACLRLLRRVECAFADVPQLAVMKIAISAGIVERNLAWRRRRNENVAKIGINGIAFAGGSGGGHAKDGATLALASIGRMRRATRHQRDKKKLRKLRLKAKLKTFTSITSRAYGAAAWASALGARETRRRTNGMGRRFRNISSGGVATNMS